MSKQYLIIFDLDGTLVQSQINYDAIKTEIIELIANIVNEEEFDIIRSFPRSILELVIMIQKKDSTGIYYKRAWELIEKYEAEGYEYAEIELDVVETLKILKEQNHFVTILTNNSRKLTDYALERFGFKDCIDYVLTRDDLEEKKPDPEGILFLMKKFSKKSNATIFIGDSWLDAEAGFRAGIHYAHFGKELPPKSRKDDFNIEHSLSKISDILELMNKLDEA